MAQLAVHVCSDAAPEESLPVCAIVTDSAGGHPDGSGHGVYADGRFFAEGPFTVTIPPGTASVYLRSGPNHVPLTFTIDAKVSEHISVRAMLHRWFAPEERGWYNGDNHVHAQHGPTAVVQSGLDYTALQGWAMGLSFITEAGSHVDYDLVDKLDTDTFLFRFAQELRPGCYTGHFNTPGITAPIAPGTLDAIKKGPPWPPRA